MIAIDLVRIIARKYPNLKHNLRVAHLKDSPEQFAKRSLLLASYIAAGMTVLIFFLFSRTLGMRVLLLMLAGFLIAFLFSFIFLMLTPKGYIRKRQREIDKDVLFAGRFLLVKMESGAPLFNSLIDASRSYGVAGKYFREIVDDIGSGVPLESALDTARKYSPSEKFKRILWQIVLATKTGTEVSGTLRSTLRAITAEQILEIKAYGKKLNSILLFYMVLACVAPSLGMTIFFIIASIVGLTLTSGALFAFLFLFAVFQAAFLLIIRAIRPLVDI